MKHQLHLLSTIIILLMPIFSFSQDTLDFISNPSFEDEPRKGGYYNDPIESQLNNIIGWYDCGKDLFTIETAPDLFAENSDYSAMKMEPSDGITFLGMVIRDNNTWESMAQELMFRLAPGMCYSFTIDLAYSTSYLRKSRLSDNAGDTYNYNNAAVLRIWGGTNVCEMDELLYDSPPVDNEEWQSYEVNIQPKSNMTHLTLQAYYVDDSTPYNGNILVDNISKFIVSECRD